MIALYNKPATGAGLSLLRTLAVEGERIFTTSRAAELAPGAGISRAYLNEALHHLARAGWIIRLKKGLYAISSMMPGVLSAHEYEIAMALVQPAAISHWSAMMHHGLTDQVPGVVYVLTPARSVPVKRRHRSRGGGAFPSDGTFPVDDFRYRFVRVKRERFFGTEAAWVRETRITVTDPERTLLDGLAAPRHCGNIAEVLHAFELRGNTLDVERIVRYALRFDTATARRLGWVLERRGVTAELLAPLAATKSTNYYRLDVGGPDAGPPNRRWMVRENLPGYLP
jgi:predicted transcriptional regulator of viral defense system